MKLSEMNTRQLAGALCALTKPMSRIATDGNLSMVFANIEQKMARNKRMSVMEKAGMLLEAVPVLLEMHYADTIRIMAIMTGRTDEEVEALNGYAMIEEMRTCIDKQFLDFFRSSAVTEQTKTDKSE